MPRDSKGKSCIDLAVYAINKSLRVPFSHKLKENGEPDRTSILYPRNGHSIEDLCVTFIDGYRFIQAPLACSERPVIQFDQDV